MANTVGSTPHLDFFSLSRDFVAAAWSCQKLGKPLTYITIYSGKGFCNAEVPINTIFTNSPKHMRCFLCQHFVVWMTQNCTIKTLLIWSKSKSKTINTPCRHGSCQPFWMWSPSPPWPGPWRSGLLPCHGNGVGPLKSARLTFLTSSCCCDTLVFLKYHL